MCAACVGASIALGRAKEVRSLICSQGRWATASMIYVWQLRSTALALDALSDLSLFEMAVCSVELVRIPDWPCKGVTQMGKNEYHSTVGPSQAIQEHQVSSPKAARVNWR